MIWWSVAFESGALAGQAGYQAMSATIPGVAVGLFTASGSAVSSPGDYTVTATDAPAPSWAESVADLTPPAAVSSGSILTAWQFIARFEPTEFAAIRASTDPQVGMFLLMVQTAPTIDTADAIVRDGIEYLVSQSLLTADRATAVLA